MKLELELSHVYGGDGIVRYEKVEKEKLQRKKTRTTTKGDIGLAVDRATDEIVKEVSNEPVNTFDMQDGKPVLRLGGVHGKLWGTMKAGGSLLAQLGDEDFKSIAASNRLMQMIQIEPMYCPLENATEMKKMTVPQILNTMNKSFVPQHFDVIEKCNATLNIVYPDIIKDKVIKLLQQCEKMATLNKRRGQIKILNWKEILKGE